MLYKLVCAKLLFKCIDAVTFEITVACTVSKMTMCELNSLTNELQKMTEKNDHFSQFGFWLLPKLINSVCQIPECILSLPCG